MADHRSNLKITKIRTTTVLFSHRKQLSISFSASHHILSISHSVSPYLKLHIYLAVIHKVILYCYVVFLGDIGGFVLGTLLSYIRKASKTNGWSYTYWTATERACLLSNECASGVTIRKRVHCKWKNLRIAVKMEAHPLKSLFAFYCKYFFFFLRSRGFSCKA